MPSIHPLRSTVRLALATGLTAAALAGLNMSGSGSASAAPSHADAATVRIGHLSPDMPGVDVYLTSFTGSTSVFLRDATYGQVSRYQPVRPGSYTFAIRTHGAAADSAPLKSWSLDTHSGYAYTAAVVGIGAEHRGVVLHDNLTPPARGHANVRFIQASSRAGTANVDAVHGPVVASKTPFGSSTGYASVPAGTWPLQATGTGTSADARVSVTAGSITSLLLLDAPGGKTRLTSVLDAAGSAAHTGPTGSVDAGAGGTATQVVDRSSDRGVLTVALVGAALLLVCTAGLVERRRGGLRRT